MVSEVGCLVTTLYHQPFFLSFPGLGSEPEIFLFLVFFSRTLALSRVTRLGDYYLIGLLLEALKLAPKITKFGFLFVKQILPFLPKYAVSKQGLL